MLILFTFLLIITSIVLLCLKRDLESAFMFGLCLSLGIQWSGILVYIAKKGGISQELQALLFLTNGFKLQLQYLLVTLGQLGYWVALGRYLFPLFLLLLALRYSMSPKVVRSRRWLSLAATAFPALSLVIYYPAVCMSFTFDAFSQRLLMWASLFWVLVYVALAILLLLQEYFSMTIRFCRRQFGRKILFLVSLSCMYIFYCPQDPAQIYLFYRSEYSSPLNLWYMSPRLSLPSYVTVLLLCLVCSAIGFATLLRYTHLHLEEEKSEVVLQRKFNAASKGVSVFIHSIKNQLLQNRVLHKRLSALAQEPSPSLDAVWANIRALQQTNEVMLSHVEKLYTSIKSSHITLVPTRANSIIEQACNSFFHKFPQGLLSVQVDLRTDILADQAHLSEALYNLMINAWEANLEAGHGMLPVQVSVHSERLWVVFEITDSGPGIPRKKLARIFDPFYSSKNSNFNWGMGLYYVRAIAKSHLGHVRVESRLGEGASFFLMLPHYSSGEPSIRIREEHNS